MDGWPVQIVSRLSPMTTRDGQQQLRCHLASGKTSHINQPPSQRSKGKDAEHQHPRTKQYSTNSNPLKQERPASRSRNSMKTHNSLVGTSLQWHPELRRTKEAKAVPPGVPAPGQLSGMDFHQSQNSSLWPAVIPTHPKSHRQTAWNPPRLALSEPYTSNILPKEAAPTPPWCKNILPIHFLQSHCKYVTIYIIVWFSFFMLGI